VSWVHHLHWGVVVIGALLGDGRVRGRVVAAAVAATLLWLRLPWWGASLLAAGDVPRWLARVVQSSYTELALLGLVALWWFVARRPAAAGPAVAVAGEPVAGEPVAGEPVAGEPQTSRALARVGVVRRPVDAPGHDALRPQPQELRHELREPRG
jgi:hypothetical protein